MAMRKLRNWFKLLWYCTHVSDSWLTIDGFTDEPILWNGRMLRNKEGRWEETDESLEQFLACAAENRRRGAARKKYYRPL